MAKFVDLDGCLVNVDAILWAEETSGGATRLVFPGGDDEQPYCVLDLWVSFLDVKQTLRLRR